MPIIKETPRGDYHVIRSVEFFAAGPSMCWRGKFDSYRLPNLNQRLAQTEIEATVCPVQPSDPLADFEIYCVNLQDSPLHDGELVAAVQPGHILAAERAAAWARVRQSRDNYLSSGCATSHGRFDTDLVSIVNLLGATSSMAPGQTMPWILEDHSVVTLSREALVAVGQELSAYRAMVYAHGSNLYQQIQSAATVEEVRAVRWTAP